MAFKLHVTISGLCLFKPQGKTAMQVLLPASRGQHRHEAAVLYDKGHCTGKELTCKLDKEPLTRHLVSFDVPQGAPDRRLRPEMAHLRMITARGLKPGLLGSNPDTDLKARVTLRDGCITRYCPGVQWSTDGGSVGQHMALMVRWTIESVQRDSLVIRIREVGAGEPDEVELFPIDDLIHVYVFHVPEGEMPSETPFDEPGPPSAEAPHFTLYGALLEPGPPVPVPKCTNKKPEKCRSREECGDAFEEETRGSEDGIFETEGIEYSCMVAQID